MADHEPVKVELSKQDMQEALVYWAARKAGVAYPLHHSIESHVDMFLMGSGSTDALFTVTLEHLDNVIPLPPPPEPSP